MNFLPVTSAFAGLFAVFFVLLSFNVIRCRLKAKVGLGLGQDDMLMRASRVHGNFIEYIPLYLILSALVEGAGGSVPLLCNLGMVMFLGRFSHAFSLLFFECRFAAKKYFLIFRQIGMMSTFAVLLVFAFLLLL